MRRRPVSPKQDVEGRKAIPRGDVYMNRLRMGILGCSGHYSLRVAVALASSLLVEPYGIASRDAQRAKDYAKKHGLKKAFGSYEELIADPDIDFIYCPLPNNLHLEYIKKCADAGKPVLCEKPLALNAHEAAQAAEYCGKKGILLYGSFYVQVSPAVGQSGRNRKVRRIGNCNDNRRNFFLQQ